MYPVWRSPIIADALGSSRRQRTATNMQMKASNRSWSALEGLLGGAEAASHAPASWQPRRLASAATIDDALPMLQAKRAPTTRVVAGTGQATEELVGEGRQGERWKDLHQVQARRRGPREQGVLDGPRSDRKRHTGAPSSNMPRLPRLAGWTPPPIQETSVATAFSTGRMPVAFGTMVGWSSASTVGPSPGGADRMNSEAPAKPTSRGGRKPVKVDPLKLIEQIAPGAFGLSARRSRSR